MKGPRGEPGARRDVSGGAATPGISLVLRPTAPHLSRARWTDAKQELRNSRVRRRRPRPSHRVTVAARSRHSPGERPANARHPDRPLRVRPCLQRSSARRGGGSGTTTTGTACSGPRRPSSPGCARISSREAASWRATWINNPTPSRTTAEGPPLLWKLHLQVNPGVYGMEVPPQVVESLLIGADFILSGVFVFLFFFFGQQKRERAGEAPHAQAQSAWVCRRFSGIAARPAC